MRNKTKIEKLFVLLKGIHFGDKFYNRRIFERTGLKKYYLDRLHLKERIKSCLHVKDRHTIYSWIDYLESKGFIEKKSSQDKPDNQTKYHINTAKVIEYIHRVSLRVMHCGELPHPLQVPQISRQLKRSRRGTSDKILVNNQPPTN